MFRSYPLCELPRSRCLTVSPHKRLILQIVNPGLVCDGVVFSGFAELTTRGDWLLAVKTYGRRAGWICVASRYVEGRVEGLL
jgi:hypothetical protein